jgi:hypothetical protein
MRAKRPEERALLERCAEQLQAVVHAIRAKSPGYNPYSEVTRVEVINHSGRQVITSESPRTLVVYGVQPELVLQDEGRTLKVFLDDATHVELTSGGESAGE